MQNNFPLPKTDDIFYREGQLNWKSHVKWLREPLRSSICPLGRPVHVQESSISVTRSRIIASLRVIILGHHEDECIPPTSGTCVSWHYQRVTGTLDTRGC